MNSKDYWIKRKAQRMVHDMDQAEKAAKQFDEIYSLASRQITSKIDQIFESYRRDHGLTEDEARRILGNVPNLTDIRGLKLSLQNATDSEEIRQLLTLLDSAPYASRIARYEALQQQVDKISTRLYKAENGASRAFYDKFIPEAYYHSIFDLQQQAGVAFAFNKIDPEEIRKIQQQPWLGANYSQRIWGNTQLLAAELQKELAVSLLTGRSAHETADFIEAQFGKGKNNARRLVRTETAYFHAEMEAKAYEEAEVDKYMFLATLDLRTSSICREHDGEVYEVSERRTGVNYPPMHPWCRSDTIALDDDEWLAKATRSARDPETGKTIQVPTDMTYKDWYAKYVKPKYKADNLDVWKIERASKQHEKYKSILGDKAPKTLDDYINIKYNGGEQYEQLKDRAYIQEKINSNEWGTRINRHKQLPHMESSRQEGKSYFYNSVDVQQLFDNYYGTGRIERDRFGRRTNKEIVNLGFPVGINASDNSEVTAIKIHHSKDRTHIVPKKGD